MFSVSKLVALAAVLTPALAASPFYCPSVNSTGFNPSCCHGIVGQVGVWCKYMAVAHIISPYDRANNSSGVGAHLIGGEPNWECNNGPPLNIAGCCQSLVRILIFSWPYSGTNRPTELHQPKHRVLPAPLHTDNSHSLSLVLTLVSQTGVPQSTNTCIHGRQSKLTHNLNRRPFLTLLSYFFRL